MYPHASTAFIIGISLQTVAPIFLRRCHFPPPGVSIFVGKSTSWQSVLTPVYFLSNKETLRGAAAAAAKGEIPTTAGKDDG